ncbi:MAG: PAS domain-containing protein [Candidatus Bathyarchaeota archaeon]|nr:PAS domain-containing protein [Candidatus Bathyarchaeota archaeon]
MTENPEQTVLDATAFQEGIEEGIIVGDLWGYIHDVNEVVVKIFGAADKSEFVGKHVLDFVVKEERSRAVQESLDTIVSNQNTTKEHRVRIKSGKEIRVEVTINLLRDKQGEQIGFVDVIKVLPDTE